MRGSVVAAFCLTAGTFSATTTAQSLPLDLSWQAPDECPSAASIARDLTRTTRPRLGRELAPLRASVVITHVASSYRLALETQREGKVNRAQLDGTSCPSLGRAVTLMLALAYGDGVEVIANGELPTDGIADPGPVKVEHAAKANVPVSSAPVARSSLPSQSDTRGTKLEFAPWAAVTGSSGVVAAAALGVEAGLRLGTPHWLTVFRVRATPSAQAARKEAIELRLSSTSIALGGCAQLPFGALSLAGCASVSAGVLRASSRGALRNGSASPRLIALVPSILTRYRLPSHWAFHLELGAEVPFYRPEFVVEGEGVLYRCSSFAPELGAGLQLSF